MLKYPGDNKLLKMQKSEQLKIKIGSKCAKVFFLISKSFYF